MRLISLNAWGGQCWPALAEWLPSCGADVLCLQEVTRAPVPSPDWLFYEDPQRKLKQRADLFGDVSAMMPGALGQFIASARGTLVDAKGANVPSAHGNAIWINRSFEVIAQHQSFAHGAYSPDGWGPPPRGRPVHVVHVQAGDKSLVIAHLHGLHHPDGKGDMPERWAQAQRVLAAIDAIAPPDVPCIIMGDLNVLPGSETLQIFANAGFDDLIERFGIGSTRTRLYQKREQYADYALVRGDLEIKGFQVPQQPLLSDHCPLILDLA